MDLVESCCLIVDNGNGTYTLKPKRNIDRTTLASFVGEKGRYVNVRVMNRAQSKTYDHTKAFWSLCVMMYELNYGQKPSSDVLDRYAREEIYPQYMPYIPKLSDPSELTHKTWSELTVSEGVEVISSMISDIGEMGQLPRDIEMNCVDMFTWFQERKNSFEKDPTDYDENGRPYSKDEWAERNKICMITGIMGGDICHIVSREQGKGFEWLINQSWNFYRGEHSLHTNVQHGMGWEALFNYDGHDLMDAKRIAYPNAPKLAPLLRKRYERAHRLFDEGVRLTHEGYSQEEVIERLSFIDKEKPSKTVEYAEAALRG